MWGRIGGGDGGQVTTSVPTTTTGIIMNHTTIRRRVTIAIIALGLLPLTAATAVARQDVGQRVAATTEPTKCALTRVGAQYVRCDYLTGNDVPAPGWVPKR